MKLFAVILVAGIFVIFATPTSHAEVAVGNCRPHLVSYSTISEAVAAVPANATVLVCPGTYPEQVTITQPLTLKGLNEGPASEVVITVPSSGMVPSAGDAEQLYVQGTDSVAFGPVNISNLVVDGSGSGVDCSTGSLVGIEYQYSSGSLENVEVRNQNPEGCGSGIFVIGSPFIETGKVNVRKSSIHEFDDTGVLAISGGLTGFLVNLTSSSIESASASVHAGVYYQFAYGLVARNTVSVAGEFGLLLENFFGSMAISENTIIGSNVGIFSGTGDSANAITHNNLSNNGTGILVSGLHGSPVVKSNTIVQSSTVGIDVDCSQETTVENNVIAGAPVGIANVNAADIVKRNAFYGVMAATTPCTD
jgi:hypothetical protein